MGRDGVLWVLDDLFVQCQYSSLSHRKWRIVIIYFVSIPQQVIIWQITGALLVTGVRSVTFQTRTPADSERPALRWPDHGGHRCFQTRYHDVVIRHRMGGADVPHRLHRTEPILVG